KFGASSFGAPGFSPGFPDRPAGGFLPTSALKPLHLFGRVGLLSLVAGIGLGVWFVAQWFAGDPIRVRPLMLFGAGLVLLGIQLILMGLLGEMIARLHAPRADYPIRARYAREGAED